MIERWKDIPGYDGKYQASTEGNIRRTLKSGQFRSMTPYHKKMKGSQRLVVKLTKDGSSGKFIRSKYEKCGKYNKNIDSTPQKKR